VRAWPVVAALLASVSVVRADEVDDLEAKGQELAKQSEFTQAIAVFKQADAKRPRAAHACMIGLAYMRREAWPQAELFLALCEKRAVPGDQPPDWIDEAEKQLAQKLSAAQIPAVTITVSPANIGARLTVSSFAPDEVFDPQTIHLAPVTPPPARETPTATGPSKVPWIVGGAGVALGLIGGIYHATAVRSARDDLAKAYTLPGYDVLLDDFTSKRDVAVGLYGAAAITIGIAVVLHYTVYKEGPTVTAQVGDHGGGILVGWQR
jgi:hypothetical protein